MNALEKEIDAIFIKVARTVLRLQIEAWIDAGQSREEVRARAMNYLPELERWRKESMADITRMLDEPYAPTHALQ